MAQIELSTPWSLKKAHTGANMLAWSLLRLGSLYFSLGIVQLLSWESVWFLLPGQHKTNPGGRLKAQWLL